MHVSTDLEITWPFHFQPAAVRSGFGGGKLSSYCIALEAWRRGLVVSFLPPDATQVEISDGTTTVRFDHSRSSRITPVAQRLVESKLQTSQTLRAHGVPVPESYAFNTRESQLTDVVDVAEDLGYPVVLKPVRGSMGKGVFANIHNVEQLTACYQHLVYELKKDRILLERHHLGRDIRVFVVGDRFIAAVERLPANVVGDGKSTINQLITAKNLSRKKNPFLSTGLISKDYEVTEQVARAGYTFESVPSDGQHLALREKANASAGGDVIDVTNTLPPRVKQAAVSAVKAIPGLPAAGVDILWDSKETRVKDDSFVIIELNSRAHIGVNMYPTVGTGQDLPKAIIDDHFPTSPRREAEAFADLTFDRKSFGTAISSGLVNRVVLAPPPAHGYPVRRLYTVPRALKLTQGQRSALSKQAKRLDVACTLRLSGGSPQVKLGASRLDSIRHFHAALTEELSKQPQEADEWCRPLYAGFRVI
ncbi:hypothetical protein [Garicola koreensis]|uniref:D-alanine-D-alanine ligase-like ATP-grasp enzyme n=1 Tax=Garicola koreensis TaxID=1262554 RepID=A0A7W5TR30_9MICC|nr:hypothetical protein [Garicola koreensis]MBB3667600.1 D-alanine-D-alanine ligase-like ATP-grasp enzyme [Garicola koreensis]